MPILAPVFVSETSVNVGFAFGNEALTATVSRMPSTAISAEVGFAAGGAGGTGTTVDCGVEGAVAVVCVGTTPVAGAVDVAGVLAGVVALAAGAEPAAAT